jgi:proteic killer suppression protein
MIVSFGDKDTKKIWEGVRVKSLSTEIQEIGRRKLFSLYSTTKPMNIVGFVVF